MPQLVSTNTATETRTETGTDGIQKVTVVTTTTEKYSDGSTKVKTNTQTKTSGGSGFGAGSSFGLPMNDQRSMIHGGSGFRDKKWITSGSPESNKPTQSMDEFHKEALEIHNKLRKDHGVDKLKLDSKLNKFAQEWAEHLAATNCLQHRPKSQSSYGENIFCCSGTNPTAKYAVENWYEEVKNYNYNSPGYRSGIGHFTQVVWKGSEKLGIGRAMSASGTTYVVADYDPAGNVNTSQMFRDNVLPKK